MGDIGRRQFLAIAGIAPIAGAAPIAQRRRDARQVGLDEFLALSARLTGRSGLDRDTARVYLDALVATPEKRDALRRLVSGLPAGALPPALRAVEREIVTAWYTGVHEAGGQRRVATHSGALMWAVLGRPAPGTCAGPTGAWTQPPGGR